MKMPLSVPWDFYCNHVMNFCKYCCRKDLSEHPEVVSCTASADLSHPACISWQNSGCSNPLKNIFFLNWKKKETWMFCSKEVIVLSQNDNNIQFHSNHLLFSFFPLVEQYVLSKFLTPLSYRVNPRRLCWNRHQKDLIQMEWKGVKAYHFQLWAGASFKSPRNFWFFFFTKTLQDSTYNPIIQVQSYG